MPTHLACHTCSGLVRHELSLVEITYTNGIDESSAASIKATKPALPSTVLVHYINGEVDTDTNLLPFADPPNPVARLKEKQVRAVSVGASSLFRSQAEIEAELPRAARSVRHAQVTSTGTLPNSSMSDPEVEAFNSACHYGDSIEAEAFAVEAEAFASSVYLR